MNKNKKECACKGNEHFDFHSPEHCCVINKCYKDCHYVEQMFAPEYWEENLEKIMFEYIQTDDWNINKLKNFIRQLLADQKEQLIKEMEKLKKDETCTCQCSWGEPDCDGCDNAKYNQAIDKVVTLLKTK